MPSKPERGDRRTAGARLIPEMVTGPEGVSFATKRTRHRRGPYRERMRTVAEETADASW